MKNKKILALLLTFVMVLSMAACAPSAAPAEPAQSAESSEPSEPAAAPAEGGVTLTLMGNANDLAKSYMESIIEQYEAATGNTIDILGLENDTFDTVATAKFATGEIPDIFQHFNNSNLTNYAVEENFYYLNDQAWVSDLTPGASAYVKDAGGNILGLPFWESSVSGCYYNKTLFDELGLKPATTQAEFDQLCADLLAADVTPICWPANGCNWMYQFGLDPILADDPALLEKLNSNQTTYADIPAVEAMAQWIKDAADKGWFGPSYLTDDWGAMSEIIGTGEAAMILIWDTWFDTDFDEGFGYTAEDFALMPVFLNTVEKGTYEGGNLNMLMVNKNSEKLDAALEFLAFCATPENYNVAFDGISTVSVFNGQTTNIQSQMVTDAIDSVNALQRTSTAEPKTIGYSQAMAGEAMQEMFLGNVDPAGCVALMDAERIATAKAQGVPGF